MKKFISLLLSFALIASLTSFASATLSPDESIYRHAAEAVALETEHPFSPLYGYSFDELSLGDIILTYTYANNSIQESLVNYIPIFNGNTLLAIAFVSLSSNNNFNVEITTDLVQELSPFINSNISLIFNGPDIYVYSNETPIFLKSYAHLFSQVNDGPSTISETEPKSISIESACDSLSILSDSLSPKHRISSFEFPLGLASSPRSTSYPVNYNIGATIIQQYSDPVCWAAVVASIGYELTGIRKTAKSVAQWYLGDNWKDGGTPLDALLTLQGLYDLDGIDMYYAPDFETIKDETYRLGHPIYVRVRGGQSGLTVALDHALFIDGYTDYASGSYIGCIFLGDPNKTSYSVVYFSEDGEYPYTLNDITGYVDAYIKLY